MKTKRTSFRSIAWLLSISMLLVWLVGMVAVTAHQTALYEELLNRVHSDYAREFVEYFGLWKQTDLRDIKDEKVRERWLSAVDMFSGDQSENSFVLNSFMYGAEIPSTAVVIIRDGKGEECYSSQSSCVRFSYVSEQSVEQGKLTEDGSLWMEMGDDPEVLEALKRMRKDSFFYDHRGRFNKLMCITGYVLGDKIVPAKISYASSSDLRGHEEYEWITVLDRTTSPDIGRKVTIYTCGGRAFWLSEEQTEIWQGKTYDGLTDLLRKEGEAIESWDDPSPIKMYNFSQKTVYDGEGEDKKMAYTVSVLVKCSPILIAMEKLVVIYQLTFLLTALAVWFVLRRIRLNLTLPITTLNAKMAGEFTPDLEEYPDWKEPLELVEQFEELTDTVIGLQDTLRAKENEINRLKQSLSYARQAEENRRSMISAVAHELKTPLAVIHGYTEGLQENIAEDKKDQYLATILSESERMDELVMEMLDLSRLEAGRVTLSRDTFSLTELIQSVFDRLSREMEKKSLRLTFDLRCEKQIHADEGRLQQVILNLASNAVRYTPAGGQIRVRTERKLGDVYFYMENDAAAFTEEELTKVWDTFYRTDRARHGKGTGLGLAIVKNIIKLHGGSCAVRNTPSGVEFAFHIPQI